MIEKHKKYNGIIVIETVKWGRYNILNINFAEAVAEEIFKIDRDNKKARKQQLKTNLNSIKQLVAEGYSVLAEAGDFQYSISFINPEGDKRPSVSFATSKDNGMAVLFDKAEEWAETVIDDYGVQI